MGILEVIMLALLCMSAQYILYRIGDIFHKEYGHKGFACTFLISSIFSFVFAFLSLNIISTIILTLIICITSSAAVIDEKYRVIPNPYCAAILLLSLVYIISCDVKNFYLHIISFIIIFVVFFLISTMLKKGIGAGDAKLFAALSLSLVPTQLPVFMLFAFVSAFIAVVCLLVTKRKTLQDSIAFSAYILIGILSTYVMSFLFV